jgi:hypothetical protein
MNGVTSFGIVHGYRDMTAWLEERGGAGID